MPVQACSSEGRPGFKWGSEGKCYTYTEGNTRSKARARMQAAAQGRAIAFSRAEKRGASKPGERDFK